MPHDTEAIVGAVGSMILAAHRGDQLALIGAMALLFEAVIDFSATLDRKPADAALVRAVERLG